MKSYKILKGEVASETLNTEVEYTLDDKSTVIVSIPHFMPDDKNAVLLGITNRGATEEARKTAQVKNELILSQLTIDK